jgi:hypothetical protein
MATNRSNPTKSNSDMKNPISKRAGNVKKKTAHELINSLKRKTIVSKNKVPTVPITPNPIQLSPERERYMAEWEARQSDKEEFIAIWARKLTITKQKIRNINQQYQKILYKQLQDAYDAYDNVLRSEYSEDFFESLRGILYSQGFKKMSNTTNSALIIRYLFGLDTSNKTVYDYSKALDGAQYDGVDPNKFAEWLEKKTLTKVIEEQRAIKKEIETPKERLDRARRIVLRMLEYRETQPMIKFTRIEPTAKRMIGSRFGLCVMLGYAYRKFGRGDDALDVDINLNFLFPTSLELEIFFVNKLAHYIIHDVEKYEVNFSEVEEKQWAEDVWERLVASCDEEVQKNNDWWGNRQQAQLVEDQYEFTQQVKQRKFTKKNMKEK